MAQISGFSHTSKYFKFPNSLMGYILEFRECHAQGIPGVAWSINSENKNDLLEKLPLSETCHSYSFVVH